MPLVCCFGEGGAEGTLGWRLSHGVIKWACINWYTGDVKLKGWCDTLHSCVSSWPCPHPSAQQQEVSVLPSAGDMALQEGAGSWSPLGPGSWESLLHLSSRLRRLKQLLFMQKCLAVESFPQERRAAWKAEVSFQTSTSRDGPVCWAGCWAAWELYIYFLLLRYQTTPPCKSWDYLRCHCAHQAPGLARRSRAGCFPPSPRNHALPCTLLLH